MSDDDDEDGGGDDVTRTGNELEVAVVVNGGGGMLVANGEGDVDDVAAVGEGGDVDEMDDVDEGEQATHSNVHCLVQLQQQRTECVQGSSSEGSVLDCSTDVDGDVGCWVDEDCAIVPSRYLHELVAVHLVEPCILQTH